MNTTSIRHFESASDADTRSVGRGLAGELNAPCVMFLIGDLGSGKTTLVRGIAEGLGIKDVIASPSYTYLRTYKIPKTKQTLYHFDLYLLSENRGDTSSLFLDEALSDPNGIIVIEWAEYLPEEFHITHAEARIEILQDSSRKISIRKN